jgi:serine/threonine-protein kinase
MHCIRCQKEIDPTFKACPYCGEPVTEFSRRYTVELLDNKYRIVERLGQGGMGEVYKAIHTYLDAVRVIKIVRASIAGSDGAQDRFLREARLATKVHHPNVATLHDFAALPESGAPYMVWEYIEGENLASLIRRRGTLTPPEAMSIARQALEGLEAIHRAGIVHRDISPENLMITGHEQRVKIIDLGVAKTEEPDQNLTKTGIFVGKLRYASPEHLGFLGEGERIDGRADLYSLAIVLHEMLTGRPPFEAASPHQYVLHHSAAAEAKPPDLTPLPAELRPVLARALERDREKRFPTASAFADALKVTIATTSSIDPEATIRIATGPGTQSLASLTKTAEKAAPLTDPEATIRAVPTVIDPDPAPRSPHPAPGHLLPASGEKAIDSPRRSFDSPRPAQRGEGGRRPGEGRRSLLMVVIPVVLLVIIAAIWAMKSSQESVRETLPATTTTHAAAPVPAPAPSQTTIDVNLTQPVTTTTAAPPPQPQVTTTHEQRPVPQPVRPAPVPEPQPQPVAPAPAAPPAGTYTEGGDGDANSAVVEKAQAALKGVTRVSVSGSDELAKALAESGLEVSGNADVTIQFNGSLEHLGRGKKRRSGHATVSRHGHVVLRYEMPPEEYRVGDTPAEAFARILREVLER